MSMHFQANKLKISIFIIVAMLLLYNVLYTLSVTVDRLFNVDEKLYYAVEPENDVDLYENEDFFSDEYDTFLDAYFINLRHNIGNNIKGSCGYVAIGMVLSYYDTFLNDDIIPEKYDMVSDGIEENMNLRKMSPGIRFDAIKPEDFEFLGVPDSEKITNEQYIKIMRKKANDSEKPSLHSKLITIGESLGYYNYDAYYPCGVNSEKQVQIMHNYLSDLGLTVHKDYSFMTYSYNYNLDKYVKQYLDKGCPVILGISSSKDYSSHSCVAYGYDDEGIYVNMGWVSEWKNTHYKISSNSYFDRIDDALILSFDMEHKHSNNYLVGEKAYCYCSDEITIYHNHSYDLEEYNSDYHLLKCQCGLSKPENHSYNYVKMNTKLHKSVCECGYTTAEEHTWTISSPNILALSVPSRHEDCCDALYLPPARYVKCIFCGYLRKLDDDEIIPVIPWD